MKKGILIIASLLALTACTGKQATPLPANPTTLNNLGKVSPVAQVTPEDLIPKKLPLTFKLEAQNNSNQNGTITFEEIDGKVNYKISLENASGEQVHIHNGSCPTPGTVRYTLNSLTNGKAEGTLSGRINLSVLKDMGQMAVDAHKPNQKTTVSCGNVDWKTAIKG